MQKLLIALLVFGTGAFIVFLLEGNTGGLPAEIQTEMEDSPDFETIQEALKEEGKRKVYGSCNAIPSTSNCVDYVGSMWGDNQMAELNCKDVGTFSKDACPYSDFGGCQTTGGSVMEMIAWVYAEGDGGYDAESVPYAQKACDALPQAKWVVPADLL